MPGGVMVISRRAERAARAALLAAAAVVSACAPQPVPPAFQEQTVEETEYRIAPADLLTVRVWKNPELSVDAAPVLPDGTYTVPLAGTVSAKGLTAAELEDIIAERLAEYIAAPDVSVIVAQVNSKRVSVVGEVNRNGPQTLSINARVVDAIAGAGGFTTFANRRKVKVIRSTPEGEIEFRFNYKAYEAGNAPGTNVRLQSGDIVVVSD
jgi:polysaccharide export outer membrane protein